MKILENELTRAVRGRCTSVFAVSVLLLLTFRPLPVHAIAPTAELVTSITPGSFSTLKIVGNTSFFAANDGIHGHELWKTDGTAGGTSMVKDINPGSAGSSPSALVVIGGIMYFSANDGVHGDELWKSDGTEAGTVLVKDINPGPNGSGGFVGPDLHTNKLYFVADDGTHGYEPWQSDGTEAGTTILKDIIPGADSSFGSMQLNVNGTLYGTADDGIHGQELWKSDGTAGGTSMVKDINPGAASGFVTHMAAAGNKLIFIEDDFQGNVGLWSTDGTDSGTTVINGVTPTESPAGGLRLATINGLVYFNGSDLLHGSELWKTDGTSSGTSMVADINPGIFGSYPGYPTDWNGTIVFSASLDNGSTYRLWKSDGSAAGTTQIANIPARGTLVNENFTTSFLSLPNSFYFNAVNPADGTDGVWRSDGSAAGTVKVNNTTKGGNFLGYMNNAVLFTTSGNGSYNLWKIPDAPALPAPANLTANSPVAIPSLSWSSVAGADHYTVYRDGVSIATTAQTTFADTNLLVDGSYTYTVTATDSQNTESAPSNAITVQADKTLPVLDMPVWTNNPKPTTGSATVTVHVADNLSGIARVEYFLGDTDPGQGNGTAMSLSNQQTTNGTVTSADGSASFGTNLQPGVYKISMRAQDAAGNWSNITSDYLVVFDPAGPTDVTASKKIEPKLANGDALPGLLSDTQNDKADLGFDVLITATGSIDPQSKLSLDYDTGKACNSPHPDNCHTTSFTTNTTSPNIINWLAFSGSNNATGTFQGQGTLVIDGATTTNPFKVVTTDGNRTTPASTDTVVVQIFNPGADPAIAVPLYQLHIQVNGDWAKIQ